MANRWFKRAVVVCACLVNLSVTDRAYADVILDLVSKSVWTVRIKGGGFEANAEVEIYIVTEEIKGIKEEVALGTVKTDANGNIDVSWPNQSSSGATIKVGTTIGAKRGDSKTTTVTEKDDKERTWLAPIGPGRGPLVSSILDTELAAAGFIPGTVMMTDISANASIVSDVTAYDPNADTVTTIGTYDLLASGPVFATYTVTGNFTNLFEPLTGAKIIGTQVLSGTTQIGAVPEASSLMLVSTAVLGFSYRWRRKVRGKSSTPRYSSVVPAHMPARLLVTMRDILPSVFRNCLRASCSRWHSANAR